MEEWKTAPLAQCLQPIGTPKKIPRKQFEDSGRFPIVSQERDFINGYWSDEADVVHVESPLVVFGDHTQTLKYIDFNFVVGADGVKLLQPKPFLDPKYFYYFLMGNPVKSLGYARHFRLLKELEIVFPEPLREQERIVAILDEAFAAIATATANAEKNLANARELFESVFDRLLPGVEGEWPHKQLGGCCEVKTGKKDVNEGNPDGAFPFFTCAKEHTYSDVYSFDTEAILIAGNGAVGQTTYYKGKFEAYQRTYVLSGFHGVNVRFLYHVLETKLAAEVSKSKLGNTMPYIKMGMLTGFEYPSPPLADQHDLVLALDRAKDYCKAVASNATQKLAHLDDLKQSLLHKAFTGELTADSKAVDRSILEVI